LLERLRPLSKPATPPRQGDCLNCGAVVSTPFCPTCGQENEPLRLGTKEILQDFLEEFARFDSKLFATLGPLFTKPGFLTSEWARGRRARYITPLKLYLTSTFIFFLVADAHLTKLVTADDRGHIVQTDMDVKPGDNSPMSQFVANGVRGLSNLNGESVFNILSDNLPIALVVMLPIFALSLKLFYVRSKRFYAEHLVFSLHNHAFYFLVLTIASLLPGGDFWDFVAGVAIIVYTILAFLRFYGQGILKTLTKGCMLGCGYVILLSLTIFGTIFVGASIQTAQDALRKAAKKEGKAPEEPKPPKGKSEEKPGEATKESGAKTPPTPSKAPSK
jgi:hypothetical protein